MNAPHSPSLLAAVEMAPRDPILGLTDAFNADKNPAKVNLGMGVYSDDAGKVPLLECVRRAERQLAENPPPRSYLPIDGLPAYDSAVRELVFGANCVALRENRIVTVQALGGTGGLKLGADLLRRISPASQVWISAPSWENHRALFEHAGFTVNTYPYYDAATRGLDFDAMTQTLRQLDSGSIVVLHACCHNPTGVDLSSEQWNEIIDIVRGRGLIPFLDMAYQGFGEGLDEDATAVRRFAEAGIAVFVSNSFSKSVSLYGERVGGLSIVATTTDESAKVLSQLKRVVRTNYSNPPMHGALLVTTILTTPELRNLWERELEAMRDRIRSMREQLAVKLTRRMPKHDFSYITRQRGMFSYSGLSPQAVADLRDRFGIYAVDSGRICVAALNSGNIDYAADAIAAVMA